MSFINAYVICKNITYVISIALTRPSLLVKSTRTTQNPPFQERSTSNRAPNSATSQRTIHLPSRDPDVTEDITESSLPPQFHREMSSTPHLQKASDIASLTAAEGTSRSSGVSTNMLMQKEGSTENIWRIVNTIGRVRTQRNYECIVTKRTLQEIEDFEEKAEEFAKEFKNFVNDGVSRKQPRF